MPEPDESRPLRVATWNIHRARGADGRVDPDRILRALATEVAPRGSVDALVLQEADGERPPHTALLDLVRLEATLGLRHAHRHAVWGPESHGFLGTIVFLGPRLSAERVRLLDLPGRCHRGAVVVDAAVLDGAVLDGAAAGGAAAGGADVDGVGVGGADADGAGGAGAGGALRLIGTHLSLGQPLRAAQMRVIGQYLARSEDRPTQQAALTALEAYFARHPADGRCRGSRREARRIRRCAESAPSGRGGTNARMLHRPPQPRRGPSCSTG